MSQINPSTLAATFLIAFNCALAQSAAVPNQIRATNVIDRISNSVGIGNGDLILGIPLPDGARVGTVYHSLHWNASHLVLYNVEKPIEGFRVKFNITDNSIEVNTRSGVKVLSCDQVKMLVWVDSLTKRPTYFYNFKEWEQKESMHSGLLEQLIDGKAKLLKYLKIKVEKPNYVPALDMGNRNERLIRQEFHYLSCGNKLIRIKNREDIISAYPENGPAIYDFIEKNKLKIKREADIRMIIEFINGLEM
jgi:hypothetical protein